MMLEITYAELAALRDHVSFLRQETEKWKRTGLCGEFLRIRPEGTNKMVGKWNYTMIDEDLN